MSRNGCTTTVVNADAIVDLNLLMVKCTDEFGKVYNVKCDYSKHIIVNWIWSD